MKFQKADQHPIHMESALRPSKGCSVRWGKRPIDDPLA
jgi:hypothetical protein